MVVCDTRDRARKLLEHKSETPELRIIVCVEPLTSELTQLADEANVDIITYDDLEVRILPETLYLANSLFRCLISLLTTYVVYIDHLLKTYHWRIFSRMRTSVRDC